MNEEGQLEPSFGWRATLVMSLRGFQLFHLRSKRRRRLLLLLLFSLTFYTVTSFDRSWGREENECLIVLNRLQQYSPFCLTQTRRYTFFLSFDGVCNKISSPSAWYISFFSDYITCARLRGSFCMTAGFGYSRLDS